MFWVARSLVRPALAYILRSLPGHMFTQQPSKLCACRRVALAVAAGTDQGVDMCETAKRILRVCQLNDIWFLEASDGARIHRCQLNARQFQCMKFTFCRSGCKPA